VLYNPSNYIGFLLLYKKMYIKKAAGHPYHIEKKLSPFSRHKRRNFFYDCLQQQCSLSMHTHSHNIEVALLCQKEIHSEIASFFFFGLKFLQLTEWKKQRNAQNNNNTEKHFFIRDRVDEKCHGGVLFLLSKFHI
jgi:hypothetical protein